VEAWLSRGERSCSPFSPAAPALRCAHGRGFLTLGPDGLGDGVGCSSEEIRTLKTLAREKTKTTVIARKLERSVAAVYLRASKLAVMLGGGRGRKGA
jgi:hypothetical protein